MKVDPFRFTIGPWKNHYSEIWRIWQSPGKDDIYLGASNLLEYIKFSIHKSGICRLAFTAHNYEELKEMGNAPQTDRCVAKWNRGKVKDHEIKQILDIHFPLNILHNNAPPKTKTGKKLFQLEPDVKCLGDKDTVTLKLLFHKAQMKDTAFLQALASKRIMPLICFGIVDGFISVCFQYSKILPIEIPKKNKCAFENGLKATCQKLNLDIGESMENISMFHMKNGAPPTLSCISGFVITRNTEANYTISCNKYE
ncbi:hypothetical protein [Paremcibacter congregatus]|uniref:Uncharacterized protein n=1 Tax=Paremcibacter congregatus TaxID=2043170 RepID=A0A2G4YTN3_9PROT|nr:hypothetical protein [Paremcibacter congregatus]PHZ84816.1 hypothetical protein CRD36_08790 [Paremcibacter congregatus]QDE26210.1 hypothetical protein FIV45_02355 [Paremcibacter congregatus]